jgi:serine/threonine protein kinase
MAMPTSVEIHIPANIGRYHIEDVIGEGASGVVCRGKDTQLDRVVAIKIVHPKLIGTSHAERTFLAEARTLARLDHPGIVPIYDVGRTDDGLFFMIAKLIVGTDLATKLREQPPTRVRAVEIVARVAEALEYAHQQCLVHRDIKPTNILLDGDGQPILIDFGLALAEENIGQGPTLVGTVPYMSPEQSRREGHRVDARSDIYSMGVVLYEMLAGRRPFVCDRPSELLQMIRATEAPPLRSLDATIPAELERICMRAMAKRVSDRYRFAREMADDLRHWLTDPSEAHLPRGPELDKPAAAAGAPIVPRGLRSFGARDADSFLDLLPGPRDRAGLPDSIAFWKA